MKKEIQKTISFRILALLSTFGITYAITQNPITSTSLTLAQQTANTILYYWHEKAWTPETQLPAHAFYVSEEEAELFN